MYSVRLNGQTFTLPEGFEIEVVAAPPLVLRPITAAFDEAGRLYVADSSGSNDKVEVQLQQKPHRIVRLEDTDGDGRFDRQTVYADRMMFPEGTMWLDGSLYVAAPPSIWKLTDTDGDGVADRREEWFQGKTLTGCANDLHGPYLGRDGWIYWCKGAFAKQDYQRANGSVWSTRAAHVFRAPRQAPRDSATGAIVSSAVEPVMTGGMDNPVDVVFLPHGERIITSTFLQHPGGGRRDGLIHIVYGGIYGKDHDVIYEHPWTGPDLMPVLTHLGPAACAGLCLYESGAFGPEWRHNLFSALFNMRKVMRHVLLPAGASFQCLDSDFLVSDSQDFHPTDIIEDADGSLLVVDTGGWYKLCCPTSQLVKPDVLGAIYRIRKKGMPHPDDPRGKRIPWNDLPPDRLIALLGNARWAVRERAIEVLGHRGTESVPALLRCLEQHSDPAVRLSAVWALARIAGKEARQAVRIALSDKHPDVVRAAAHVAGLWRDREAVKHLSALLHQADPATQRPVAEALGRLGDAAAVPALLHALESAADRILEHSLIYALIEIGRAEPLQAATKHHHPRVRRAVLVALDQMPGRPLAADQLLPALHDADDALRETAWWIAGRHPEWGAMLVEELKRRVSQARDDKETGALATLLARYARAPAVQDLIADLAGTDPTRGLARRLGLRAMASASVRRPPTRWLETLTAIVREDSGDDAQLALAALRSLPVPQQHMALVRDGLLSVMADQARPVSLRVQALAAMPGDQVPISDPMLHLLLEHLRPQHPVHVRSACVAALNRSRLTDAQLIELAQALHLAGPLELERLLDCFAQCKNDSVGSKLLDALRSSPLRSALRPDAVKRNTAHFGPGIQRQVQELLQEIHSDLAAQQARLEHVLGSLKPGDVRRGQAVFNSPKAGCISCHAIGYLGGRIGPDLTHIGKVRSERDLLESILFPSASFVRSYEPIVVLLQDGRVFNGLIQSETPEEIVLATGADQTVRISRADIEDIQPSKVSIMPTGLDQVLTIQELSDLIAFLKACQ